MYPYVYFPLFISIVFFSYEKLNNQFKTDELKVVCRIFLITASFLFSAFYAWREIYEGFGGIDADTYKAVYDHLSLNYFEALNQQRYEKGYGTLVWLFKYLFDSYEVFQLIYFLLMLFMYRLITKNLNGGASSLISYFLIAFFLIISFNLSRMMLGVFLLFFVVKFLSEERYKEALLFTLISSLIQMACLWGIVFIVYHYSLKKIKSRVAFASLFFVIIANSFLLVQLFKSMLVSVNYGHYVAESTEQFSGANYIYAIFLSLVYYVFFRDRKCLSPLSHTIFQLLPTMLFIIPLYLAVPIAYRFNFIYILFFAFLIPDVISYWRGGESMLVFRLLIVFIPVLYSMYKIFNFYTRDVLSAELWVMQSSFFIF